MATNRKELVGTVLMATLGPLVLAAFFLSATSRNQSYTEQITELIDDTVRISQRLDGKIQQFAAERRRVSELQDSMDLKRREVWVLGNALERSRQQFAALDDRIVELAEMLRDTTERLDSLDGRYRELHVLNSELEAALRMNEETADLRWGGDLDSTEYEYRLPSSWFLDPQLLAGSYLMMPTSVVLESADGTPVFSAYAESMGLPESNVRAWRPGEWSHDSYVKVGMGHHDFDSVLILSRECLSNLPDDSALTRHELESCTSSISSASLGQFVTLWRRQGPIPEQSENGR